MTEMVSQDPQPQKVEEPKEEILPKEEKQSFAGRAFWTIVSIVPLVALLMSEKYKQFTIVNSTIQLVLFGTVSMIPGYKTGRLSYVDIAWPWGLAVIGALTLALGNGATWRKVAVGVVYLLIGGRMGLGAITLWSKGFLNREFPRYDYRKLVWKY